MEGIPAVAGAAVGMFAGTNVDDLVVLTTLFLSSRASGRPTAWKIWVGQYLGIAVLIGIAVVAALGLAVVPERWVGLLGLVPLALGVRGLIVALRHRDGGDARRMAIATSVLAIAGVTIANGADNIAVYTPVFRTIGPGPATLTIAVFAAGVAVWCVAGSWLGSHPKVVALVARYGHWLVPGVFMAIGVLIIAESGVLVQVL